MPWFAGGMYATFETGASHNGTQNSTEAFVDLGGSVTVAPRNFPGSISMVCSSGTCLGWSLRRVEDVPT